MGDRNTAAPGTTAIRRAEAPSRSGTTIASGGDGTASEEEAPEAVSAAAADRGVALVEEGRGVVTAAADAVREGAR